MMSFFTSYFALFRGFYLYINSEMSSFLPRVYYQDLGMGKK